MLSLLFLYNILYIFLPFPNQATRPVIIWSLFQLEYKRIKIIQFSLNPPPPLTGVPYNLPVYYVYLLSCILCSIKDPSNT
jgi:hypothetical protein